MTWNCLYAQNLYKPFFPIWFIKSFFYFSVLEITAIAELSAGLQALSLPHAWPYM